MHLHRARLKHTRICCSVGGKEDAALKYNCKNLDRVWDRMDAPGKNAQILERGLLGLSGLGVSVSCRKLIVSRDRDFTRSRGRRCMPEPTSDETRKSVCSDGIVPYLSLIVDY